MKNREGFTLSLWLILLLVIIIVGLGGYIALNKINSDRKLAKTTKQDVDIIDNESPPENNDTAMKAPDGWVQVSDPKSNITYYTPAKWSNETNVAVYNMNEEIPFGYGAPVYLKFNVSTKSWEEYELDIRRTNTNTVSSRVRVADTLPTVIVSTGDGPTEEKRIIFADSDRIIQISLPAVQGYDVYPYNSEIDDLIQTITVR